MARRPSPPDEAPAERDEFLQAIGTKIREARLRAGLTGAQVAETTGTAKTWVYAVEDGRQNFTIQALRRLLKALDLDMRDILPSTPDLAAETARLKRLHQLSSSLILLSGDLTQQLNELRALTGPAVSEADEQVN